tara:strand:- start:429 stop:1250 length:822 start_codon:yes stop_codon:yes gene_type:complete
MKSPIGVFDSGYGGLTVLNSLKRKLNHHDFIYLGDNARAPYGTRSFELVYQYTLEAVKYLFEQNCHLIILACNTASAKALRTIQQNDLPNLYPDRRVLGVLRPTTEEVGKFSKSGYVGVLGTTGTINSNSYKIEINKFFPKVNVIQQSCPMWVPMVENNSIKEKGGQYYIQMYLDQLFEKESKIDTIILGCTHYPLLRDSIEKFLPSGVQIIEQGDLVAEKLQDYLKRHQNLSNKITSNSSIEILTTENNDKFDTHLNLFYGDHLKSRKVSLG